MRSGTSLVNRLLCSAPDANDLVPECQFFTSVIGQFLDRKQAFDDQISDYFGTTNHFENYIQDIARAFVDRSAAALCPDGTLVLKNPEMTRLLPHFAHWFGGARFIICVRDPLDTLASVLSVGNRMQEAQSDHVVAQLARQRNPATLAQFFNWYYERVLITPFVEDTRVLYLRYEDVVADTADAIKTMARHTGLDLSRVSSDQYATNPSSESSAAPGGNNLDPFHTPLYDQPVSDARIGTGADIFSDAERQIIRRGTQAFAARFGYATS